MSGFLASLAGFSYFHSSFGKTRSLGLVGRAAAARARNSVKDEEGVKKNGPLLMTAGFGFFLPRTVIAGFSTLIYAVI